MKKNSTVVKKDLLKKAGIVSAAMLLGISMMACGSSSGSDKASAEKTTVASEAAKETKKAGEKFPRLRISCLRLPRMTESPMR